MNATNDSAKTWSASELLFMKYHGTGFSLTLTGIYFVPFFFSIIACLLHGSLIYVTIKCKLYRQGLFNWLIAWESLGSMLLVAGSFWHPPIIALSGSNFVPALPCFFLQIPSLFGIVIQHTAMLFIGIERLLAVAFPLWIYHKHLRRIQYTIAIMLASSISFAVFLNIAIYQASRNELKEKEMMCHTRGDLLIDWILTIYIRFLFTVEACTVIFYVPIWLLMFRAYLRNATLTHIDNLHILRALSVIMALIIFGWMQNALSPYIWPYIPQNTAESIMAARTYFSLNVLITTSSNAPVLYYFSSEYRRQFKQVFKCLESNDVVAIQQPNRIMTTRIGIGAQPGLGGMAQDPAGNGGVGGAGRGVGGAGRGVGGAGRGGR